MSKSKLVREFNMGGTRLALVEIIVDVMAPPIFYVRGKSCFSTRIMDKWKKLKLV